MSITFEIVKFKMPTKDDLSNLHMFNPYGAIPIPDILLFLMATNQRR